MNPSEQLMKDVVEAWGHGDLSPLFAALHDDVVWSSASAEWDERIRSGGTHRGRPEVVALFSKIATAYFLAHCELREIFSRGDTVWGVFNFEASYMPVSAPGALTPKPVKTEILFRWRIQDGKITHAQTFFDTAALIAQQQGDARIG
jgi:ketosteroid isomerase-like protein